LTNDYDSLDISVPSRYPKDPVEKAWPRAFSASRPKHRSSLRKICRFLKDIHRMYDQHANESQGGPSPPPYKQSQREELTASSVHELSDALLATSELYGHASMFELQGSTPNANDYHNTYDGYAASSAYPDVTKSWGLNVPQPLAPIETQRLPWPLNTEARSAPVPGIQSGGQSHKSSPTSISPVTPQLDGGSVSQPYPLHGFMDDTISPRSLISPQDNHWAERPSPPTTQSYTTHSSFPSSLASSPTEPSSAHAQNGIAEQPTFPNAAMFADISASSHRGTPYSMSNQHSFASQNSVPDPQQQWHGTTAPGIYEHHEQLGWYRRLDHGPGVYDVSSEDHFRGSRSPTKQPHYVNHPEERHPGTLIHAENGHHQFAQTYPLLQAGEETEETVFPPKPSKPCGKCEKVFHGRYVNSSLAPRA
jgi:hypothetical protein